MGTAWARNAMCELAFMVIFGGAAMAFGRAGASKDKDRPLREITFKTLKNIAITSGVSFSLNILTLT
jgi:hypothetical protein